MLQNNEINFRRQLINPKVTLQGFTLIELLVTIIIVGVLSTIALPSFLNQVSKARGSEAKASLGTLNRAQQAYRYERSRFAPNLNDLQAAGLSVNERFYQYNLSGTTNTSIISADPRGTDLKVYSAGASIGADDRFAQVICESLNMRGSSTENTALAEALSGSSASVSCTVGREIQ
jgi:type IV pilus assembly protein PilA